MNLSSYQNKKAKGEPERVMPYEHCRAKTCSDGSPGTTVLDHCRYAGAVGRDLCNLLVAPVKKRLPPNPELYVALHDLGKVSPGFQGKYFLDILESESPDWACRFRNLGTDSNHANVGAASYRRSYGVEDDDPILMAIAGHHGRLSGFIESNTDGPLWQKERDRLVEALEAEFRVKVDASAAATCDGRLMTGLTCVSDWIASDEGNFPPDEKSISGDELAKRVEHTLKSVGFFPIQFHPGLSFGDIFKDSTGRPYHPRSEQSALIGLVDRPGVYVMEATMGAGKTEAALYAAYKMIAAGYNSGIYFALPTRLTSDRIYLRTQAWLNAVNASGMPVRLSHGRAWLDGFSIGGEGAEAQSLPPWFSPSRRGLLYPFAVGTIDQALLSVMRVKHSNVRLFGLAGKVVILDEVHSYDMYTGSLVDRLVHDLSKLGCTVIILSATLTKAKRNALLQAQPADDKACYPLVTALKDGVVSSVAPSADASAKRVELEYLFGCGQVVRRALAQARQGCNVLCVANTVRQAQTWFYALKEEMNESDAKSIRVGLLHSRFPTFQRQEIENEWMELLGKDEEKRPNGSVLISTQIVEQSVDIDADYMISEVAPIDMLLQRMGRLWRHPRKNRSVQNAFMALAFEGDDEPGEDASVDQFEAAVGKGSCCVYAAYVLWRTLRVLHARTSVSVPNDLRVMLETVYADVEEPSGSAAAYFKNDMEGELRKMKSAAQTAEARVLSLPEMEDSEDVSPTRYGSRKSVSLLLVKSVDFGAGKAALGLLDGTRVTVDRWHRDFAVTKNLYDNIVSVPKKNGLDVADKEASILRCHFHKGEMPLVCLVNADGELVHAVTDNKIGLCYGHDKGVFDIIQKEGGIGDGHDDVSEEMSLVLGEADW